MYAHIHALAEPYNHKNTQRTQHATAIHSPTLLCLQCACGAVHTGRCPAGQPRVRHVPASCSARRGAAPGRRARRAGLNTAPEPCRSAQARRRALGGTRGSARVIRSAGRGSAAQVNALPPTCARPACGARCWLQTTAAGAAHSCPPTRSPGRRLQLAADHPPIRSKQATRHHASGMRAQLIPMLAAWRPRCRGPAGRMA